MLISFNVINTREAMAELKEKDYPFIHPSKMNGVLLELIDDKDKMGV